MTTKQKMEFPRINFVALLAGALFLVSIFLYWWGLDTTGSIAGSSVSDSLRWSLWSGPSNTPISSSQSFQTLVAYSPVIGVLAVASAILTLLGTIPKAHRLLIGGGVISVLTSIFYAVLVSYTVSNGCGGSSNCISGPFGTETMTVSPFGLSLTRTWGFQTGFYVEIVGAVLAIIAIAFHRTFLKMKAP